MNKPPKELIKLSINVYTGTTYISSNTLQVYKLKDLRIVKNENTQDYPNNYVTVWVL